MSGGVGEGGVEVERFGRFGLVRRRVRGDESRGTVSEEFLEGGKRFFSTTAASISAIIYDNESERLTLLEQPWRAGRRTSPSSRSKFPRRPWSDRALDRWRAGRTFDRQSC